MISYLLKSESGGKFPEYNHTNTEDAYAEPCHHPDMQVWDLSCSNTSDRIDRKTERIQMGDDPQPGRHHIVGHQSTRSKKKRH